MVTVVIPAFNAHNFIGETLKSILTQTYKNLEIIVVDDGSYDTTSQIVKGYGSRVAYYHQENSGGCSVPRNTGIRQSSGDFLCFMDADDLMLPDRITRQVEFMNRHPSVGLVFCDYKNFTEEGPFPNSHFETCPILWPQLRGQKEFILENSRAVLAQENFGIAGSFMIRRTILKHESGFDPTLKSCEDFHFYFRLARHTPVGVINMVGMMRRVHGDNMSGNVFKMRSEGIRCCTLLKDGEKDPEVRKNLDRYIASCRSDLARYCADQGRFHESFRYDFQVLTGIFLAPEIRRACRNILRTIAMAMGLHRPRKFYH